VILVFATPEEARELLGLSTRQPEIVRPQTSGPCVHYDEQTEYAADAYPCTYPYGDGTCPHLDNPDVLCPVKDACYAQVCSLCVHYDERSEHVDNIDPCTHPDACEGGCPYLDDDGIYCPQKEVLAWALGDDTPKFVPLAQDPEGWGTDMVAEAPDTIPRSDYVPAPEDPQAQADDAGKSEPEFPEPVPEEELVYETAAPEWVEPAPDDGALHTYTVPVHEEEPPQDGAPPYAIRLPPPAKRKNAWTEEENWTVARADTRTEAIEVYRAAYPDSTRTDKAILSRWEKLHRDCRVPLTLDTVGDTALVTQCDEDPVFTVPHPTYRPGDRVRIKHALHRGQTGKIERYFPATDNYLVAIDGLPDRIILRDKDLEVEA